MSTTPLPEILHFSSQETLTKYEICQMLARLHSPPLDISNMKPVTEGPKPGETIRPKDCHLSNVSLPLAPLTVSHGTRS